MFKMNSSAVQLVLLLVLVALMAYTEACIGGGSQCCQAAQPDCGNPW